MGLDRSGEAHRFGGFTRNQFELFQLFLSKESPTAASAGARFSVLLARCLVRVPPLTTSASSKYSTVLLCKIDSMFVCKFGAIFEPLWRVLPLLSGRDICNPFRSRPQDFQARHVRNGDRHVRVRGAFGGH